MVDISFTIVMQWINFGVLLFLLYRFLFKPLGTFLKKRSDEITHSLETARTNKTASEKILAEYNEKMKTMRREADSLLAHAHTRALEEKNQLIHQAQNEARTIVDAAKDEIGRESAIAKSNLIKDISTLVIACASKVLEREVRVDDHRQCIEEFISQKG